MDKLPAAKVNQASEGGDNLNETLQPLTSETAVQPAVAERELPHSSAATEEDQFGDADTDTDQDGNSSSLSTADSEGVFKEDKTNDAEKSDDIRSSSAHTNQSHQALKRRRRRSRKNSKKPKREEVDKLTDLLNTLTVKSPRKSRRGDHKKVVEKPKSQFRLFKQPDNAIPSHETPAFSDQPFLMPSKFNLHVVSNYCILTAQDALDEKLNLQPGEVFGCMRLTSDRPLLTINEGFARMLETCGKVIEMRSSVIQMGSNRHDVYVTYSNEVQAEYAVKTFNKKMIRPGQVVMAEKLQSRVRLYVGSIPKNKTNKELQDWFSLTLPGISHVFSFPPERKSDSRNRGFCFVEFVTPGAAHVAYHKLKQLGRLRVEWPVRKTEIDGHLMRGVTTIHVRPLMKAIPNPVVLRTFGKYGHIEELKRLRTYSFIRYDCHESALHAVRENNGRSLFGNTVEVGLAIPEKNKKRMDDSLPDFAGRSKRLLRKMNNDHNLREMRDLLLKALKHYL